MPPNQTPGIYWKQIPSSQLKDQWCGRNWFQNLHAPKRVFLPFLHPTGDSSALTGLLCSRMEHESHINLSFPFKTSKNLVFRAAKMCLGKKCDWCLMKSQEPEGAESCQNPQGWRGNYEKFSGMGAQVELVLDMASCSFPWIGNYGKTILEKAE